MHLIQDQTLTSVQVIALTKAMLSVAAVDDIQTAEAALIGQFYEASRSADMPDTAALLSNPDMRQFDVSDLLGSTPELADTVVLMCLMTAYADGDFSDGERAKIQAIASELNLTDAHFEELLGHVRDALVGALSHLPDTDSVAMVVKELAAAD